MAGFRFRLETLMRLRQTARDECRQELAAAQNALQAINDRIDSIDDEAADLHRHCSAGQSGSIDIDRLKSAAQYQSLLAEEKLLAMRQRDDGAAAVDRLHPSLVEADRELKSLEKLRNRQQDRHLQTQRKHDLRQLDEAGLRIANSRDSAA